MSAAFVLAAAKKDLVRRLRDPLALALWVGIPLLIGGLLTLLSSGGGGVPQAHVLVADEDGSFLSELLVNALGSEQARVFRVEPVEAAAGRARLDRGDGSALLVIPPGFGEALMKEEPCELELVTNPAQRIMPGLVEEALSILADGAFYLHRLMGEELTALVDGPPGGASFFADAEVGRISERINARMRGLERWLFPPAIRLETETGTAAAGEDGLELAGDEASDAAEPASSGSIGALFFPTMLFMALFFVAQGLSDDVWRERALGTLRRALTTPPGVPALFLGKLVAGGAVAALVAAVGLAVACALLDVTAGAALVALGWATVSAVVLTLLMTALQLHASSQRAGSTITNVVLFPLLMLGGCFFPFEAMPDWMERVGRRTPNGFALTEFQWLLAGGLEPLRLARDLGLAALVGGALFALCVRRCAGAFARS